MKLILSVVITFLCLATPSSAQFNRQGNRQVSQKCFTPEQYVGSCVALSYCPQVTNVYQVADRQTANNYVIELSRSCGTRNINGDPVVCCTRPITSNPNPVTEQPPNPFFPNTVTQQPPNPFFPNTVTEQQASSPFLPKEVGFVSPQPPPQTTPSPANNPFSTPAQQQARGPSCRNPSGLLGECVEIKSCPSVLNELLVKQKDAEFAKYLQASNLICGQVGKTICCPTGQTVPTPTILKPVNPFEIPRRLPTVSEGCGHTSATYKKIVGGKVSKKGTWPWIALLGYKIRGTTKFLCGGTLISARHVITAAHCMRSDLTFVRLGEHDLSTDTEAQHIDINIAKKVLHPQYNRQNGHNDIAILYLDKNVEFTNDILPICMPSEPSLRSKSYVNYNPFVVGWGKTMEGGESSMVLQELQIPVLDNEVCRSSYQKVNRYFTEDQFDRAVLCAGVLTGGKDTCQGDSGGPLMTTESVNNQMRRFYLIGIVSYGVGCARPEVPGVYTSTQYFMDWIIEKLQETL